MNDEWVREATPFVDALRVQFVAEVKAWWDYGARRHSVDSLCAHDLAVESQYATEERPTPVQTLHADGAGALRSSLDYLEGAIDVVLSDSLFSSFALTRCSLEGSARGYWLLDSNLGLRERLLRGAQYRAWYLAERRRAVDAAPNDDLAADLAMLKARERGILDWARRHQLTDKTSPAAFARSCPGFTRIVGDLMTDLPEGTQIGHIVYRWLSGTAHSNPVALLEFGQSTPPSGDDHLQIQLAASPGRVFFPIWWAARGLQFALARLAHVNSWQWPDKFLESGIALIGQIISAEVEQASASEVT